MRILIATVGGPAEPVKLAIRHHEPSFIYFICSRHKPGQSGSCRQVFEAKNSIVKELHLTRDSWEIVEVESSDTFSGIFSTVTRLIRELKKKETDAEILVDYSGGTKTMSLAAALAGIEENLPVYFVDGIRDKNDRIIEGTEIVERIEIEDYLIEKFLYTAEALWEGFFYQSAASLTEKFIQTISEEKREKLKVLFYISRAFGLWDRFQHDLALDILKSYGRYEKIKEYLVILRKLSYSIDEEKNETKDYLIVVDLLYNARRRAEEKRFEDAIGRIYRALELLAQIRLYKEYGISTADVDPYLIPDYVRNEYVKRFTDEDGKLRIPLFAAHKLICNLGDDVWNDWFVKNESLIRRFLQLRNFSFYAHGLKAVDEETFHRVTPMLGALKEILLKLEPDMENFRQLPRSIRDLGIKELEF